jgi:plastocyanin
LSRNIIEGAFKMRLAFLALVVLTSTIAACTSAPTPAQIPAATHAPAIVPTRQTVPTSPTQPPTVASPVAPTAAATLKAASPVTPTISATLAPKQVVQVQALDDFFRPENITVTAGTRIDWINVGQKKHTVTNDTLFDSDLLVGQTFSFTFDKPGTYQYYCVVHSESPTDGMVGTVTVVNP